MARSSLLGVDSAAAEPAGRDKASLGPGDSSDSGSDMSGLEGDDDGADPGLPVDVALRDDHAAPLPLGESLAASEGETGVRDGADIGVDRVFTPDDPEDIDALLEAVEAAPLSEEENDGEDEEEEQQEQQDRGAKPRQPRQRGARAGGKAEPAAEDVPGGPNPAGHRPGRS